MSFPFAMGEHVYLRPVEPEDAERVTRWMNDRETTRFILSGRYPLSVAKERAFLEGLYGSEEKLQVGICLAENDLHIGMCGLHDISRIHRSAILGILIGERTLLGKGHGSEALRLLIDHAFRRLNLHRLELGVFHTNARALACYRKLGFVEEGRLRKNRFVEGEYVDEIVMGLLREEWKG